MDSPDPGGIVLFLLLLVIDAIVYGFGSALHSLRREDPDDEGDDRDNRSEKRKIMIRKILEDQSDYTDTVQLITTGINFVYGAVYARGLAAAIEADLSHGGAGATMSPGLATPLSYILSWLILLIVIETLGAQIPKRLGAAHPEKWADRCGWIFHVFLKIFLPLVRVISTMARGILYVFGVRGSTLNGDVTEEEIRSIVNEGHEQGVIEQTEAEMITNIFEFSDKEAGDIMTNRSDIISIESSTTLGDAVHEMLDQHNSRFPVYTDNIDTITGVVHMRDAVKYREDHPEDANRPIGEIREVLRQAIYVPETKSIDDLFRQMQKAKAQLVIVIDEYGQTSGIVAMEDILEEIVGNIMDEYDVDENHITATGNKNEYIVDGRTPLEDLTKKFGIRFEDDRFETLNGFLMSLMDRVPESDCHFETQYDGFRIRVLSVEDRQVERVLFTRLN
ncbi:putative hemolysin [Lachnospiraceae bacterium NK3A20]|nr:putative hemolysin [Lachnospiraceae bacterium NK3A20]